MTKKYIYICNLCPENNVNPALFVGVVRNQDKKLMIIPPENANLHLCMDCFKSLRKK